MLIKLDVREKELKDIFVPEENQIVKIENLELGDVILIDENDQERIIFERKTIYDLASSIKDGRYNEQSLRLDSLGLKNHNIIYLIEGDMIRYNIQKGRIDKKTLYSAMTTLNYFKGFSVIRSLCLEESVEIIKNYAYKIEKQKKSVGYYDLPKEISLNIENNENNEFRKKHYSEVIKKCKKENITKINIGEIMISNIPSVSNKTAIAIMERFKTIRELIVSLEKDKNCLDSIKLNQENGSLRKINKTAIKNIVDFLI